MYISMYDYTSIISKMQSTFQSKKVLLTFFWFDLLITWKSSVTNSIVGLFFLCISVSFCFVCFEDLVLDEFKFGITFFLRINQGIYQPFLSPIILFISRYFCFFSKLYQPSFDSVCPINHSTLNLFVCLFVCLFIYLFIFLSQRSYLLIINILSVELCTLYDFFKHNLLSS